MIVPHYETHGFWQGYTATSTINSDETSSSNTCNHLQGKSVVGAMHVLAFFLFSRSGVSTAPLGLLWGIILFQDLMFVGCTLLSAIGMVAIYIDCTCFSKNIYTPVPSPLI